MVDREVNVINKTAEEIELSVIHHINPEKHLHL
jgi:hypothetical protein